MPSLNEKVVRGLPTPSTGYKLYTFPGAIVSGSSVPRGLAVRVTANGVRAFVMAYRVGEKQRRYTIGQHPDWSVLAAVREARALRQRIDRGEDPAAEKEALREPVTAPLTVNDVLDQFEPRHVAKLRTGRKVSSMFARLVRPGIGAIPIHQLKRRQLAEMLDTIEDENGPVQVERVRAHLGKAFRWFEGRDDEFRSPMMSGMARNNSKPRTRALTEAEICAIWPHLHGAFGDIVKLLLLTGQRRGDIGDAKWSEVSLDRVLTVPAARYKGKRDHAVPLTDPAWEIIDRQQRGSEYVFTGVRGGPYRSFHDDKAKLDAAVPLPHWRLHDLRRTAKTFMAKIGVLPHISERVLGHAQERIEGTYDVHAYLDEKRRALEALAGYIDRILNPAENVVPIRA